MAVDGEMIISFGFSPFSYPVVCILIIRKIESVLTISWLHYKVRDELRRWFASYVILCDCNFLINAYLIRFPKICDLNVCVLKGAIFANFYQRTFKQNMESLFIPLDPHKFISIQITNFPLTKSLVSSCCKTIKPQLHLSTLLNFYTFNYTKNEMSLLSAARARYKKEWSDFLLIK